MSQDFGTPTHRAELKGFSVEFSLEHHDAAIAKLVEDAGGYDSSFKIVDLKIQPDAVQPTDDTPLAKVVRTGRIEGDAEAAMGAGFVLKEPLYAVGRRVNDLGVDNARSSRVAYDAKPTVSAAVDVFSDTIANENRKDSKIAVRDIQMSDDGRLSIRNGSRWYPLALSESAFDAFTSRTGIGGSGYLKTCWPALRATNCNAWIEKFEEEEQTRMREWLLAGRKGKAPVGNQLVLRVRNAGEQERGVYAVVSPKYQAMDCDVIGRAIADAAPEGAKGSIVYDGQQARFEVLFHSDVSAEDYGCGEIFRAGIIVRTNDVGDGSIRVSAMVERNLCLNLIVLDTAEQQVAGIRHIGSELTQKFADAFEAAMGKLKHFRESWGYARQDEVGVAISRAEEFAADMSARDLLAGIAWGQMQQELVPVRGRKPEVLKALVAAYDAEPVKGDRLVRTDVVNAWTRYAHETAALSDPWIEDDIQSAAGKMLQSRKPMPYVAAPFVF
jgi:hypothetical protein